jgi:hypothetical protein
MPACAELEVVGEGVVGGFPQGGGYGAGRYTAGGESFAAGTDEARVCNDNRVQRNSPALGSQVVQPHSMLRELGGNNGGEAAVTCVANFDAR